MKSNGPLYVSSLYRSGSTLLTLIIDQSPQIKMSYDTIHYMRFSYNRYQPINENYKKLLSDTNKRLRKRWSKSINVTEISSNISNYKMITEAIVYNEIMKSHLDIKNNERWGEKTNVNWEGSIDFLDMYPNGKVLIIYRDPRAVLSSYKKFTYHKGHKYLDSIFSSLAMFNFIKSIPNSYKENIILLKYEDLVQNATKTISLICNFLDIEFSLSMLNPSSFIDNSGNLFDSNSSFFKNRKNIDSQSLNIWKSYLEEYEIYLVELITKNSLLEFGYELTNVKLSKTCTDKVNEILNDNYIKPRFQYWKKFGNGVQSYPDSNIAYST